MKKISFLLLLLGLCGCKSTAQKVTPIFNTEVVEIKVEQLSDYWILDTQKVKIVTKRPNWFPKGQGQWKVLTIIDSNGHIVESTLVSSSPEGYMTQSQLDKIPRETYRASVSNVNRTPVKFYGVSKITLRN